MILNDFGMRRIVNRKGVPRRTLPLQPRLRKVCVVNCAEAMVYETIKAIISGVEFHSFELAIDGIKGNVYKGNYPLKTQEIF